MPKLASKKSAYLPTLDGWRAIAILAVIFHHDAVHVIGFFNTRWLYDFGNTGVDVFFAISGILICSRLLDEESIFGKIHLKSFYIRRAFRILPPALLYLGVIALLGWTARISVSSGELLRAIFFSRNYPHLFGAGAAAASGAAEYFTKHFWSLSLEEQFYFFLPAMLVFVPRKFRISTLTVLAALILIRRAVALHFHPWSLIQYHTDIRIDSLLVPALFAIIAANSVWKSRLQSWLRIWPILVLGLLCAIPFGIATAWHATLIIWTMPCIILGSVLNANNIFGRILELAPLKYVGRISYSLYLWQQLFFVEHFSPTDHTLGWIQNWPIRLVLTFACAMLSYHLLERPVTRIGHKLAPSPIPGREAKESAALEAVPSENTRI